MDCSLPGSGTNFVQIASHVSQSWQSCFILLVTNLEVGLKTRTKEMEGEAFRNFWGNTRWPPKVPSGFSLGLVVPHNHRGYNALGLVAPHNHRGYNALGLQQPSSF